MAITLGLGFSFAQCRYKTSLSVSYDGALGHSALSAVAAVSSSADKGVSFSPSLLLSFFCNSPCLVTVQWVGLGYVCVYLGNVHLRVWEIWGSWGRMVTALSKSGADVYASLLQSPTSVPHEA